MIKIYLALAGDIFHHKNLPQNFNYANEYHYLVESINKTSCHNDYDDEEYGGEDESIGEVTSKSLKKGTWSLKSGYLHDNADENNQCYILRRQFQHSMKNLPSLNTKVCVSIMSGFVKIARCDCKAGLVGRGIVNVTNSILENAYVVEETSTSLPCYWNKKKQRKPKENFMSQCMNPINKNIPVFCTIGIHDQVNIKNNLVRTWNGIHSYL